MTLIIGCITSEFAVLAGDTQLTVGDLQRGTELKREVEIKVSKYSHRFMMGILGKWSWFSCAENGTATYINDLDILKRRIQNNDDEVGYLKEFLPNRQNLDATAIFIDKKNDQFTLDYVSSKTDQDLSRIKIEQIELMFNEPFFYYQKQFVQNKILEFSKSNDLGNTLGDIIFLVNNIILEIIAEGRVLDVVQDDGVPIFGIANTVGGYVTIEVMTKDDHHINCLYRPYIYDYNTLLDKRTYPFSLFVDKHKEIRYLDNMVMLIKGSLAVDNDKLVRNELLKCIAKQLTYLSDSGIIKNYILNKFIDLINEKYDIELDKIEKEEKKEVLNLMLFLDEKEAVDLDYIKNFI